VINAERNRALLTNLFAALEREGWGVKCFSPRYYDTGKMIDLFGDRP
jgi:hypothetical protein